MVLERHVEQVQAEACRMLCYCTVQMLCWTALIAAHPIRAWQHES